MFLQCLYVLCYVYIVWWWQKKIKNATPQPPEFSGHIPIIGHMWKFIGDRRQAFKVIQSMSKETLEKGGVLTVNIGPHILYAISDPDDCLQVANECLDKDYYYDFAKPYLGNGLTTAEVPLWKQHRKLMNVVFRPQILNGYLGVFNHQAKQLVEQFKAELGKEFFNHEKYIRLNNLESICLTAFGADIGELGGIHQQFLEAVEESTDIITERFQKVWLHSDFLYKWSNLKKRLDVVVGKFERFTSNILAKRKMDMYDVKRSFNKSENYIPFVKHLLELSEKSDCYSEKDIMDETTTIVSAGYETSACTNTLALILLGTYQNVQEKAYQEIRDVFGDSDRDVTKEDLRQLVYLDAVFKEITRLYPIGPLIARYMVKDVRLKNYTLKAGNGIGILIWALHRHPMWGPDADLFRPERWLDGSAPSNTHAYGAFSLGKRSCIGKTYATMSIKTGLVHILRSYKIYSDMSKVELEIDATLRVASGQSIRIEKRNPIG